MNDLACATCGRSLDADHEGHEAKAQLSEAWIAQYKALIKGMAK